MQSTSSNGARADCAVPAVRPLVSIVIPNHNYAHFLPGCLRSILNQTLDTRQIEVLFVDDASTDGSLELAQELLQNAPLAAFRSMPLPRIGRPGPVRNYGLAEARGRTLLTLDPDDELRPDYLARCLEAMVPGVDVVYTDYQLEEQGVVRDVRLNPYHKLLLANQNVLSPTALFRRRLWDRGARFRRATTYEDWDFWIQLALLGANFAKVALPLYLYRMHGANYSFAARVEDGQSKARIVLDNPGFYPTWTLAWAKSVQQGEPGADPMGRGIIPVLPEHASRRLAL